MILLVLALLSAQESRTTVTPSADAGIRLRGRRDDGAGHVTVREAKGSVELMHFRGMTDILRLSTAYEAASYDYTSADLWKDVNSWRVDPAWMHVFDATWTGILYGNVVAEWEPGAHIGESVGGAVGAGVLIRDSGTLTYGGALHVRFQIEDSPELWPLPYLDWKISDTLTLKTEQKAGYGLTFEAGLDDAWSWASRARYRSRRVRLDGHGFNRHGVFQDERFIIDTGPRWNPSEDVTVGLYAGVEAWQLTEIEDRRGHEIDRFNTYAKPVVGITASIRF